MKREEVASEQLRHMVKEFAATGLPAPYANKEAVIADLGAMPLAAQEARKALEDFYTTNQTQEQYLVVRMALQKAIEEGHMRIPDVRKYAVLFGAIPSPEEKWKYFIDFSGDYLCWECGGCIMIRRVKCPIHDGPFPLSGSGRVKEMDIPYCPTCDPEPQAKIITVNPMEELAEELAKVGHKPR